MSFGLYVSTNDSIADCTTRIDASFHFVAEPLTYTADETLAYGSAIWHMNCTTGSLDALWTTADGTSIPMHFLGPSEVLVSGNPNILKERGFEGATQLVSESFLLV